MKKSGIAMGILSMAFLASCTKDVKETGELTMDQSINSEHLGAASAGQGQNHVPNEILLKFKKGTSETARGNALARINGKVKEHILTKAMERVGDNDGVYLVHTPLNALEAIAKAKGLEIEFAEPNFIYTHDAASNDPLFTGGSLWGMKGNFGSNAEAAWIAGHTGTNTVYIGIIDEGYMYSHEDLDANAGVNPKEIAENGIDDDGNKLIDDVYGWDFATNDNSVYDGTGDDHGTHVAGTIGGVGGNGIGVAGVCWNVKLLSAKFLGASGGSTANAIKAVDYFTNLKKAGLNIVATNNSWGGGGFSQALYDAIERANAAGVLFIAAAGNGGSDGRGDNLDARRGASYPASYTNNNIIAVASITSTGAISSFSNYGAKSVDIGAPGSAIYSTLPDNKYGSYSGTSMATPHVAGAAALYAAHHPGSSAATIKSAILGSAVYTASLNGKCVTNGRLNVGGF